MGYLCINYPIIVVPRSIPSSSSNPKLFKSQIPISRYCHETFPCSSSFPFSSSCVCSLLPPSLSGFSRRTGTRRKRKVWSTQLRASMRESPYDVLGVSPSATTQQIKRAYRKLALKYHPDVNKEANAQEKFMRIKYAYNTLINPNKRADYSSTRTERNKSWNTQKEEEEFYGLGNFFNDVQITIGDFFRDLQVEFQNWENSANSREKPKSLWEELADIGEEFVEFLEKELNVTEEDPGNKEASPKNSYNYGKDYKEEGESTREAKKSSVEENIDEIEAALAQLKKELGL